MAAFMRTRTASIFRSAQIIRSFCQSQRYLGAAEFEAAKTRLNALKEEPPNDVKLQIYGLFKQATTGKCDKPKPGALDFVGKAKWSAWNGLGDMSKDDAQTKYVDLVADLAGAEKPAAESATASSGKYTEILTKSENGIFTITLNRPAKKNAINNQMYNDIIAALSEAANDDSVVTVITGSGDFFCSGNDLGNFANVNPSDIQKMAEDGGILLKAFVGAFIDFPKALVALVNGPAVGVSVTTLALYDAVFATERATFNTPFTALGQTPEGCSSYLYPKLMGAAKANSMLMFNKKLTATEACDLGLVTEVFPDHSFQKEAEARVAEMSKLPKQTLRKAKNIIREVDLQKLHQVNQAECDLLVTCWTSDECINAIMAFFTRKSSL